MNRDRVVHAAIAVLALSLAVAGSAAAQRSGSGAARKSGGRAAGCSCCAGGACSMASGRSNAKQTGKAGMAGMASGMQGGGRTAPDPGKRHDMAVLQYLLSNHTRFVRSVRQLPDGVETVTESDDPTVAARLKEHVPAMYGRLKSGRGLHLMDPLFAALFQNGKQIASRITLTDKGVKVTETSTDPYVVKLIKAHAKSVDELIAKGQAGLAKPHEVPKR